MSADEAISSATPSEIIANAVPLRCVETHPSSAAKNNPVRPPTRGTTGSGIGSCVADDVDGVNYQEAAKAVVDRVSERKVVRFGRGGCCRKREKMMEMPIRLKVAERTARAEALRQHQEQSAAGNPDGIEISVFR